MLSRLTLLSKSTKATKSRQSNQIDNICPYASKASSLIPDVQVKSQTSSFPVFLCENKGHGNLEGAIDDLVYKLQHFDEKHFHGLPFYLTLACTPKEAQFVLSCKYSPFELGNQIGVPYRLDDPRGRGKLRPSSAEPLIYIKTSKFCTFLERFMPL